MKSLSPALIKSLAVRTALAAAAVAACSAASAQSFTFNPAAAGLVGASFTASNLTVKDYATIIATPTGFTEHGYLNIVGAESGGTAIAPGGLLSTYGLYVEFNAVGTGTFNSGVLGPLTYTLYGFSGTGVFTPTSAPTPTVTLGTGSLSGSSFYTTLPNGFTAAGAQLSFAAASSGFFGSPTPFYTSAQTSFTNTPNQFILTSTGATVNAGGGSISFLATPVPEPETYALLLGGLAAVGFLARRRSNV